MDFFSIIMFLGLYYIRPQEWISVAALLQPVKVAMILAIIAMLLKYRERPFLKELFRTPHDWIMLVYFVWILGTTPTLHWTFSNIYSLLLFYLVTVQALSNIDRILAYLSWWTFFIVIVALLALASEYGFDPMNSYDVTHGPMKGRLALNTSIFNNANALGHGIVPAIPMLYFLLFWNRPVFSKIATIPVMFFPLYCIFLTLSKGSFISGFATVVSVLTFRRPKAVQALIFLAAITMGWAGMKLLPRMQDLEHAQSEGGIQGRVAAFQFGFEVMKNRPTGLGFQQFIFGFIRANHYTKAAHSSYVQVGADLGFPGLFLFLGIFYCCLRTLVTVKTTSLAEERVRRLLFVLLLSFMVSSWMVSWCYRASFYLMVGVIAAFHRQMLLRSESAKATESVLEPEVVLAVGGTETPLHRVENPNVTPDVPKPARSRFAASEYTPEVIHPGIRWNRFNWVDFAMISVMLIITVKIWQYVMHHI